MSKRKAIKNKIKNLTVKEFNDLLSELMITDEQRKMMKLIYLEHKPQDYIADTIGVSLSTVKWWHSVALDKIVVSGLFD